ncbi:SigE family RNA polymerase sigma factor [Arsenicicoccus dermatophilus]|uniref:SigE family RNA polymerase sigma factor n=1 Tax=Arsenicicoccus dermatophilus TaxID=1076331 RepID=UPI0039174707
MDERDEEFTAFVAARSAALLRYAYLLTGDHASAEDLLQNTLVKVYLSWHKIADRGSVEAYTRTAMTRTNISVWRKVGRREFATETTPDRVIEDRHDIDERDGMWALLQTLGPRQRTVLVLRFYEDLPEAEIAHIMGCSLGTVKSQLSRGLANLRKALPEDTAAGRPAAAGNERR